MRAVIAIVALFVAIGLWVIWAPTDTGRPLPAALSSSPVSMQHAKPLEHSARGSGLLRPVRLTPKRIATILLPRFGFRHDQFSCLNAIYTRESGWNKYAENPSSGAYGIPQALPGSKMASAGANWRTSARTQIRWGLGYIRAVYGTPCNAWAFWQGHGWY